MTRLAVRPRVSWRIMKTEHHIAYIKEGLYPKSIVDFSNRKNRDGLQLTDNRQGLGVPKGRSLAGVSLLDH